MTYSFWHMPWISLLFQFKSTLSNSGNEIRWFLAFVWPMEAFISFFHSLHILHVKSEYNYYAFPCNSAECSQQSKIMTRNIELPDVSGRCNRQAFSDSSSSRLCQYRRRHDPERWDEAGTRASAARSARAWPQHRETAKIRDRGHFDISWVRNMSYPAQKNQTFRRNVFASSGGNVWVIYSDSQWSSCHSGHLSVEANEHSLFTSKFTTTSRSSGSTCTVTASQFKSTPSGTNIISV